MKKLITLVMILALFLPACHIGAPPELEVQRSKIEIEDFNKKTDKAKTGKTYKRNDPRLAAILIGASVGIIVLTAVLTVDELND